MKATLLAFVAVLAMGCANTMAIPGGHVSGSIERESLVGVIVKAEVDVDVAGLACDYIPYIGVVLDCPEEVPAP